MAAGPSVQDTGDEGLGGPPPGEPYAAVTQTQISVVLFVGALAYKVKKPVRLPFLDLSRWADRLADCRAEVDLNRRIAPDVYLGVGRLPDPGTPGSGSAGSVAGPGPEQLRDGEPVVVMRRMPSDRRLSRLIADGHDVTGVLAAVARQVAVMHGREAPVHDYDLAATMASLWREGRQQLAPFAGDVLEHSEVDEAAGLAAEYLRGRAGMLAARERSGHVRDGHGDLLTDDIFCLDDGPRILDCLEFDRRLRLGDVLLDVAFLAMDLVAHGRPDLADRFLDCYRELTHEQAPRGLVDHYIAYRAFVRTKMECLRHRQGEAGAADRARSMLALCRQRLRAARVHLVLVGGLPGVGKSTLAATLVDGEPGSREWALLSGDVVRKELAGVHATTSCASPFRTGLYDPGHTDATYTELLHRARVALERGVSVVLDASWTAERHREAARGLADSTSAMLTEVPTGGKRVG